MASACGDGAPARGGISLLLNRFPFPDRRILFFGGKGGVGKTTIASAAALRLAGRRGEGREGYKTLLVSTDPAHSTSDIFQTRLDGRPRPVAPGCSAMEIDPEREADAYIEAVKSRVASAAPPRLLGEVYRQIDIARVSPGAAEAALFDRFTRILEDEAEEYDRIVFDTAPTGQTLRLLALPESMSAWIGGLIKRREKVGAISRMWNNVAGTDTNEIPRDDPLLQALEERRSRFDRARRVLADSEQTAFVFVVTPERLPIWETEKAVEALARNGIPIGAVVVNKVLPASGATADPAAIDTPDPAAVGVPALAAGDTPAPAAGDAPAGDTGDDGEPEAASASPDDPFMAARREREAGYLARISETLGDWPLLRVTLQETDPVGADALRRIPVHETSTEVMR